MTIDSSITYILPIKDNRNLKQPSDELELSEGEMDDFRIKYPRVAVSLKLKM